MPTGSSRPSSRSAIADETDPLEALAPLARLALAYAPAAARADWLTFLALDQRLAGVVRSAREPMLGQLKLAWWRDRLAADPATWPRGEPLLARLAPWDNASGLAPLVDGWEALLDEPPLDEAAIAQFAQGRAAALEVLAGKLGRAEAGAGEAARRWALADLALNTGNPHEQEAARAVLADAAPAPALPRALRPLVVLRGVSERALARGGAHELHRPGAFFAAVRLGLLGR